MQEAEAQELTDLEPRCRLCLLGKDIDDVDYGLQNIYNEDDDSLPYKIRDCLGVFVSPEDSIQTICTNCLQTVYLMDEFRTLCRQTEEIYESVLIRCEDSESCERYGEYIGELRKFVQEHKTKINGQLVGVEYVDETVDEDSISTHFVPMLLVKDEPEDNEKYLSDEPPMAMEELDIKPEQLPIYEDEDDDENKLEISEAAGSAGFLQQVKLAEALLKRLNRFTSRVENQKQLWAEIAEHMDMEYTATRTRWNRMKRRYLDSKASAATGSQQTILRLKGCTLFNLMNQIVPKLDKSVEPWVAPESVKRLNKKVYPIGLKTAIAEEIKKCPELYDKSLASSTHTMDQAWKKIAKMFDMDAINLRFHWRSLQDLYRTHTRRLKLGVGVRAKTDVQFYKLIGILQSIHQVIDAGAVKQESVAEQCTVEERKKGNLLIEQEEQPVGEDAEEQTEKNVDSPPDSQRMILAKLVYQHKHLWNKKHQDFHNALARDTAWDRIAETLEVTREEVKYSWKCLRDLYRGRVKRLKQGTLRPNARVLHEPLFKQLELMFVGNMRIGSVKGQSQQTSMVDVPKTCDSDSDDATDGDGCSSKIECDTNMRLAELCEKHKIIWNSKHPDHANKERRDIVWDSIAQKMDLTRAQTKAMWTRLRNVYRGRRLRLLRGNLAKDSPLLQEPLYQKLNAMLKDHMHLGKYGGGHHKGERTKPGDAGPFPSMNAKVKLVEEVIKYEFLWNATHPDFHNAIMRENTWRRIAVSLNQSSTQAKYAYKLLRDSYRSRMKRMKQTNTDPTDHFEYDPLFEKLHIMFSKSMRIKIKQTESSKSYANMVYESESNDVFEDNEGDDRDTEQHDIDENMKLVLLCEKNELIWNSKHSDHFNHEKRDAVWDAIALETNLSKTCVKEMWTRLRNIYRTRRLRYLQGSITRKNHLLCDPLYKKLHAMLHGHMQLGKHGGGFPKTNGPGKKPGDSGPFSSMENKVRLVEEVSKHEYLWNTTHVDFHNTAVRDSAWSRIAVSMNESVTKLKYTFKLLRDAYRYRVKQMKQSDTDLNPYFEHDPLFEKMHMMFSKSMRFNKYQKIVPKRSEDKSESNDVSEDNVGGDTEQNDIDENMKLVLICEKNEAIWNSTHPDYINYKKRDEVWNTIALEMNLPRIDVKGMWTRLRHIYRTRRIGYLRGSITNKNVSDPLYQKLHALFDGHMQLGKYGGGFPNTKPRKKKIGDAGPISSMEDKVKLAKEVFKHEHLWNTTHADYFKSDKRGATWNQIASMFNNCDAWAARGEWLRLRNMHRPRRSHGVRHYEPMDDNEEPEPQPVISNPLYDLFSKMAESLTAENDGDPGDDGEPSGLTRTKRPKKRQIEEITEAYMTHKRRYTGKRSFDDEGCIKVTKGGIVRYEKICELCGKQIERSYFEYHMNQHNGLKPYVCSFEGCGRQYSNKITRDRHEVMIHCDEGYKYDCDQCDEKFKYRSTFDYHYAIKHKSQKVPCRICGKLLKHKTLLREHLRRHNGNFPCNVCGKVLQKKYSLDVHMRTHTNEKPYPCEICGQCFMLKVQMKTHLAKVHQMSWEEFQSIYGSTSQQ